EGTSNKRDGWRLPWHDRLPWPNAIPLLPPESQPLCTVGSLVSAVSLPLLCAELEGGQKS
ncbi:hypothetical protein BDN70DRAFT_878345, partial [Pholiota conissans]